MNRKKLTRAQEATIALVLIGVVLAVAWILAVTDGSDYSNDMHDGCTATGEDYKNLEDC